MVYGDCTLVGGKVHSLSVGDMQSYEAECTILPDETGRFELKLMNESGEEFSISFDMEKGEVIADRSNSGLMTDIDSYVEMPAAPLCLCNAEDGYDIDVFVDRCSVEVFIDGGCIAMTNLVFPTESFDKICIESTGDVSLKNINIHKIK